MKTKTILKTILIISLCFLTFTLGSYFYLQRTINNKNREADKKQLNIPYSSIPQNNGVLFSLPDGSGVLIYLCFSENNITALLIDDCTTGESVFYGYPADYTVECDYNLLAGIIDNAGGITLQNGEERLRYTGIQAIDLLSFSVDFKKCFKEIIGATFKSISENGFTSSDAIFILQNCFFSTLTLPECIDWYNFLPKMAKCTNIIG